MGRTMVEAAVRIGAQMGIKLRGGTPVKASGNCLIESVKGNIEERDIFYLKLNESSLELRLKSALEGERVIGESPYRIEDYSEAEWAQGWNLLKNEGIWNVEYFGDLMIIALAHYIHKNILLINTDPDSPNITVILGDQFGAKLDSDVPVILAYSGDHYESLIPSTNDEEERTKALVYKYVNGEDYCHYKFDNKVGDENNTKENKNIKETKDPEFFIDNWEHHKDDNKAKSLSNSLQNLVLSTTETATKADLDYKNSIDTEHTEGEDSLSQLTGIDNWKHCYPVRGIKFSSNSNNLWGDENKKVSIPIPILRIKTPPKMISIPITRVSTPCKQQFISHWDDSVSCRKP